jgi:hypothetical protein
MMEAGDNIVADDAAAKTFALPLVPLDEQLRRASSRRPSRGRYRATSPGPGRG